MIRLRLIRRPHVRTHVLRTPLTTSDNLTLAHSCQRTVTLRDGRLVEDVRR
jgi:predicted ABC-type transport system involved in lysophospholipase L1 biosynthesis ATPase subunit